MATAKFELTLNTLLSKDSVDECDLMEFIKNLALLTKAIKHQNGSFKTFAPIVKNWIGAYQTIFSDAKISEKALKCINQSCSVTTEIFFNLMQTFRQFEPEYSLELCYHWKYIVSRMRGSKRVNSFIRHIELFKTIVENLRTAKDRCEQMAILGIIKLYIDHVPSDKMTILKERYNKNVVEKLIELKQKPTTLNQHAFLHDINAMGRCIISLQSTKIICKPLSIYFNISNYGLWLDFNLRDNSIIFVALSLTDNMDHCLAVATAPKLKENASDEHVMKIRGTWSILRNGETFRKRITVTVIVPMKDRNPMWKTRVRNIFPFETDVQSLDDSIQQECSSQVTDKRFAYKHPLGDGYVETPSQLSKHYESGHSSSITCLPKDTTLKQLYETNTAVEVQQRHNMNSMLLTPFRGELQQIPRNCKKHVAENNYSVGNVAEPLLFDDLIEIEQNLTEARKEGFTQTAQEQLVLDDVDNQRIVPAENQCKESLNDQVRQLDIPKTSHLIQDWEHSSGLSFCDIISIDDRNSDEQNEIVSNKDKHSANNPKLPNELLETDEEMWDEVKKKPIQDIEMLDESIVSKHNFQTESQNSSPSHILREVFSPTQSDVGEQNEHIEKFIQQTESIQSSPGSSSMSLVSPMILKTKNNDTENIKTLPQLKESVPVQVCPETAIFKSSSWNSKQKQSDLDCRQNVSNQTTQLKSFGETLRSNSQRQNENEEYFVPNNSSRSSSAFNQKPTENDDMIAQPKKQTDTFQKSSFTVIKRDKSYRNVSTIKMKSPVRNWSRNHTENKANIFRPWESLKASQEQSFEQIEENVVLQPNQEHRDTHFTKLYTPKPKSMEVQKKHDEITDAVINPNKSLNSSEHEEEDAEYSDVEMSDMPSTPTTRKVSDWASEVTGDGESTSNHDEDNGDKQHGATIRIDVDGMVFDDKGLVFYNDEELQLAWEVFIENNGLDYLESDEFKSLPNNRSERIEREFRTIQTMINEGFDLPFENGKRYEVDQDVLLSDQSIITTDRGTTKRKSPSIDRSANQLDVNSSLVDTRFDFKEPSDNKMKPNDSIKKPNEAGSILSQNNLNHSKSNVKHLPDQINTTVASQLDSKFSEKLPIYASKRFKSIHHDNNNGEQERDPLPSFVNENLSDPLTTADKKGAVPEAVERNNLDGDHKHHTESCNNVGCNSLVNHLNELMAKPKETCDPHKRLLMALLKGLQNIHLEDHRQLNVDLAELMKTAVATIKSVSNKASLDAALPSQV